MDRPFDYFVVFAEMRTGSNFLESNLNAFPAISCVGEAFNPHFIGYPDREECLGVTEDERNRDPAALLRAIQHAQGIAGFRFFHDHDPRVLDEVLTNPRCGKIILTRNPVESYVSWKIAQTTGQWKLTNVARRKEARAHFDPREFQAHLSAQQDFQLKILRALQTTGQTAFYVAYEDLQDVEVMNGIAAWLGQPDRLKALDQNLKPQNPEPLAAKVENYHDMERALAQLDRFNLARTPNFEPRRGAVIPSYLACPKTPLMYLPIRSGPETEVRDWMAALDGVSEEALLGDLNQKELRKWMRATPGRRSFTVVRHPVARAHHAFCTRILSTGPGSFATIRNTLRRAHKMPIPSGKPDDAWSEVDQRAAFLSFLDFVRANLSGQTAVRQDAHWASQSAVLQGMSGFASPDLVLREDEMAGALPALARRLGHKSPPAVATAGPEAPHALDAVYDEEVEAAAQQAYARDYLLFGFGPWRK